MRKTGESYSSARRYFHTEDYEMTNATNKLQPDLWPDWVQGHPWLVSFLTKAEAEARNRGDTRCDHFHVALAFLGLGPPVFAWLETLGLDAREAREDTVEILGMKRRGDIRCKPSRGINGERRTSACSAAQRQPGRRVSPRVGALRHLTGISSTEDTSYDVRVDDAREWMRSLAASHGADPAVAPYDIHRPRP